MIRLGIAILIAFSPALLGWLWWQSTKAAYEAAVASVREAELKAFDDLPRGAERVSQPGSKPTMFVFGRVESELKAKRRNTTDNIVWRSSLVACVLIGIIGARCKYWLGVLVGFGMFVSYMLFADAIGGMLAWLMFPLLCMGLIGISSAITGEVRSRIASRCV